MSRSRSVGARALGLCVLSSIASAQGVIRVPADQPTISAALTAAAADTTILCAPGIYNERLTWPAVDGIRLIAEEGSSRTTIHGNSAGPVISFTSSAITAKTLIEGFEITGGLIRNQLIATGAGVLIRAGAPTLRGNLIFRNTILGVSRATGTALGAGVFVGPGANPRIERNTFNENTIADAAVQGGAAVAVSGGGAEIVGNTFVASALSRSDLRAIGAGVLVDRARSAVLIASNTLLGNDARDVAQADGGGIAVDRSGDVTVVNNTVVNNRLPVGIATARGAGMYFEGSTAAVHNNIVAFNVAAPTHAGIEVVSSVVTADFNNVWSNQPSNYGGIAAGANDLSVDPKFVGLGLGGLRLQGSSPMIDAGDSRRVPGAAEIDVDGDPRRLDGSGGLSARVDIGADEFSIASLRIVSGAPRIGTALQVEAQGPAGTQHTAIDLATGRGFVSPLGTFLLSPRAMVVSVGPTGSGPSVTIPNATALRGITFYLQAAVLPVATPGAGVFTNRLGLTIY